MPAMFTFACADPAAITSACSRLRLRHAALSNKASGASDIGAGMRPGEVSLDETGAARSATPLSRVAPPPPPPRRPHGPRQASSAARDSPKSGREETILRPESPTGEPHRQPSIRVNVDTLEHLMTMVSGTGSERNQLL